MKSQKLFITFCTIFIAYLSTSCFGTHIIYETASKEEKEYRLYKERSYWVYEDSSSLNVERVELTNCSNEEIR